MNVAIIPARGGSTRIPRKNIRNFAGKPIISWSIEAALSSGCFDHVIVSTDDDEIADIARSHGATAPFKRPSELSGNHIGTMPVIRHAIEQVMGDFHSIDFVCCIHATAPFIKAEDLIVGLKCLKQSKCDYAFPVTEFPAPIQRALRIDTSGYVDMFQPENFNMRSQDLEMAFYDAAQFWWGRTSAWLDEKPVYCASAMPIRIPRHRSQDIDTPEDWIHAELMFKFIQSSGL
ncbi:pseudaminic acid cytidylyltransferase [Delftia lacustris]|uniref:N-acylneuraminate cytidylyltransferase n=1 Tax=Delftia lacustris TaxID=558537 RepID=A0A1H3FC40_9BURK|nr:pseudaminic acid cytidylyltransferase [Delftia lacustris]SDX87754.1 N-acylneuraminate cytidylyltransferase [Delftia lacustris]